MFLCLELSKGSPGERGAGTSLLFEKVMVVWEVGGTNIVEFDLWELYLVKEIIKLISCIQSCGYRLTSYIRAITIKTWG